MKPSIPLLCLALLATVADGATVEVSTDGWTGCGNTNGWTFASLGTNGTMTTESFIESPVLTNMTVFAADIRLKCSSAAPERLLQVVFLRDSAAVCTNVIRNVFRPDRPETQHLEVDRSLRANAVRLSLSGLGTDDWDILSVALTCAVAEPRPERKHGFRITIS